MGFFFHVIKSRVIKQNKAFAKRIRCESRHTWIYKDDQNGGEYMTCSTCGTLPGDSSDELYDSATD